MTTPPSSQCTCIDCGATFWSPSIRRIPKRCAACRAALAAIRRRVAWRGVDRSYVSVSAVRFCRGCGEILGFSKTYCADCYRVREEECWSRRKQRGFPEGRKCVCGRDLDRWKHFCVLCRYERSVKNAKARSERKKKFLSNPSS